MNIRYLLLPSPISGAKDTKQGSGLGRTLCLAALFVTFATAAWADVELTSYYFPDSKFLDIVKGRSINTNGDKKLSDAELQAVTEMDVSKKSIGNLEGIEYFTALKTLKCFGNKLTQLDVSALTNLVTLECYDNSSVMTTLNATGCTALKTLKCFNSKLKALSLGRCSNLATLDCHSNQLTALNISACVKLTSVSCYGNSIRGDKMVQFINRLPPKTSNTNLDLIYNENASTGNEIMHAQVLAAKAKKWTVRRRVNSSWSAYAGIIALDETTFPDPNFLNYVRGEKIDTDNDGILSEDELANVTEIRISSKEINDLTGIECFEDLTYLSCSSNNLTSLDLSKNTKLETLSCYSNQLTSLDLSNNEVLRRLYCENNQLTSLNLPDHIGYLECFQNHLQGEAVDNIISKLPYRKDDAPGTILFYMKESPTQNKMTSEQLETIKAKIWNVKQLYNDGYDDLWVDYVPNHDGIYIDENAFPDEYFRWCVEDHDTDTDGYLSDEEVAAVKKIEISRYWDGYKYCSFESLQGIELLTQLETLEVKYNSMVTSFDASVCPQLKTLSWTDSKLASLNISGCTQLTELICYGNPLESLDLTGCTNLKKLSFSGNPLESLDLTDCPNLEELNCSNTPLPSLDLSNRTSLKTLYCGGERSALKTLNVSGCTSLDYLSLDAGGVLSSVNASGCTKLELLFCYRNQLTELNVSGCTQLKNLYCYTNQLTSLDVSGCTQLEYLDCFKNQLTSLNVSGCTKLKQLQCYENQLTSLEISDLESQCWFYCRENPLATLKVTNCKGMTSLSFYDLHLTSIDLSGCPSLNDVYLPGNRLRGKAIDDLIEALPEIEATNPDEMGKFYCINMHQSDEQSRITAAQAARLKEKGWQVRAYCRLYGGYSYEYDGHGPGDVDGNGVVDADDVNITVSHILGLQETGTDGETETSRAQEEEPNTPEFFPIAADVTGDGEVDITDLTQIISKVGTVVYKKPEK